MKNNGPKIDSKFQNSKSIILDYLTFFFFLQQAELLNVLHFMYNGEVNVAQVKIKSNFALNCKWSLLCPSGVPFKCAMS
jgi:hypothetical protein